MSMSLEAMRKGWCPGALRPMAAKDGLLVRLRITGGILSAAQALAIADLAERHGNSLFDLSARGNLQLRGVSDAHWPALVEALQLLGIVDEHPAAEAVRNVMASPLAGLHDGLDIRPLSRALEAELVGDEELQRLPGKFGFLIDDGIEPSLAHVTADVRFDYLPQREIFSIGLGGTRTGALRIGVCSPGDLVARAHRVALGAIASFWEHDAPRRLRGLIDSLGEHAIAAACGGTVHDPLGDKPGTAQKMVGACEIGQLAVLGLATPFGRLDANMLRAAAAVAERSAIGELRLTPWRSLLVATAKQSPDQIAQLSGAGFIVDAHDARLAVVACVGRDGCVRGSTPTHEDARYLADLAAKLDTPLHVSGCEKGCARAEAAPFTLVARNGRYDLIEGGRPRDMPVMRGLDLAGVRAALEGCAA